MVGLQRQIISSRRWFMLCLCSGLKVFSGCSLAPPYGAHFPHSYSNSIVLASQTFFFPHTQKLLKINYQLKFKLIKKNTKLTKKPGQGT